MKKLYDAVQRFCAAHPRFGIPNLMRVIVIGNVAVYVLMLLTQANDANALSFLTFNLNAELDAGLTDATKVLDVVEGCYKANT